MEDRQDALLEKLRQQYNTAPFPRKPLDKSPLDEPNQLFHHYLVNPYYLRNQKVVDPAGKTILDAGSGSGYKALALAFANPGAKIVGIDLSEESVRLAEQRLRYYGFTDAEFYVLAIEDLASLNQQFDYINCDEVLYFLADPVAGLRAMKSVLKPDGIIRTNLHSSIQRAPYFRAQQVFKMMGFMDRAPQAMELGLVRETMAALKNKVQLKVTTWFPACETDDESVWMNHLIVGDRGFTVPEMFSALQAADLEFIEMMDRGSWRLEILFEQPERLSAVPGADFSTLSRAEELELFELFQPNHRLLDFWCGHPNRAVPFLPIRKWSQRQWQQARIHLHPHLRAPTLAAALRQNAARKGILMLEEKQLSDRGPIAIDSAIAATILPLLAGSQSFASLVERWQQLYPLHPVTLDAIDSEKTFTLLKQMLIGLEHKGYVMLERLNIS